LAENNSNRLGVPSTALILVSKLEAAEASLKKNDWTYTHDMNDHPNNISAMNTQLNNCTIFFK